MSDFILFSKALILGIIQGLTEFIPVSSTGHMVIFGKLLQFEGEFADTFKVFIQLGATCALIWNFRHDLLLRFKSIFKNQTDRQFAFLIIIAFLPVAIVGLLFNHQIEFLLDSALCVAIAQMIGALLILIAEHVSVKFQSKTTSLNAISWRQALAVGLWQIASLWPGMSRSGSTIMGGLLAKIDRPTATLFSFYLSIPITFCSSAFMLLKHHDTLKSFQNIWLLCVGFLAAFAVGLIVVRFIMSFVRSHSFGVFAYYRIVLGILILVLISQKIL